MTSRSDTRQHSGDTLVQKYIKAFAIGFVGFSLTYAVTPARVQFAHPRPLTLAEAMQRCAALFSERNVRKVAVADFAATGMPADNRLAKSSRLISAMIWRRLHRNSTSSPRNKSLRTENRLIWRRKIC